MLRTLMFAFSVMAFSGLGRAAHAQCQQSAISCQPIMRPFNFDGSYFRASLYDGESAKMRSTFYRGMTYRVIPCGKSTSGKPLLVSVYDNNRNGVFHSANTPNQQYFDIQFGATGEYVVEVRFADGEGCAALLIGHRQH